MHVSPGARSVAVGCLLTLALCASIHAAGGGAPSTLTVDYPQAESIFPPDIVAPMFLWRDDAKAATLWKIEIAFGDGAAPLRATSRGKRMRLGPIDPECISKSNRLPELTPSQAAAHTWRPAPALWEAIKKRSAESPATITFTGYAADGRRALSRGSVTFRTSRDPVGAPVFYRDVPLMPTETEQGRIKPLAPQALPLVNWRLKSVGERGSRLLLTGMPVCANCHSFSDDGKTMGMDLDGLQNNKGQYFLTPVQNQIRVALEDVIQWRTGTGKLRGNIRAGFMSRVSPDGQYVVTTINPEELTAPPDRAPRSNYYVTNYADYRFLQVFYPTRGILAWYSRETGLLQPLPGADDPRYVQMTAAWGPRDEFLVFARAAAQEPNPPGAPAALVANDPNERQIRYDLYRIPFNHGRGGTAEPVEGASANGMSNTFPKVSPDGKWIVYVRCRNGQLMRPDSELYIVPAQGGPARRMRCNTPLMNSWHSFSPNGRWLVFSSKSRSPYTQMYLTHIDADGNDSPAILVEDTTAANRAVNLPEFVNVAPNAIASLGGPALDYYKLFNHALYLQKHGRLDESAREWRDAIDANPADPLARDNYGVVLLLTGGKSEAAVQIAKARELRLRPLAEAAPPNVAALRELGELLCSQGRADEAVDMFRRAVETEPGSAPIHAGLGDALLAQEQWDAAAAEFSRALAIDGKSAPALYGLGVVKEKQGAALEAIALWRGALGAKPDSTGVHLSLAHALYAQGEAAEAMEHWRAGLAASSRDANALREAAWTLATRPDASLRNGEEALALAVRALRVVESGERRANEALPSLASVLDTLAAAYAECGRFGDAAATVRRALASIESSQARALSERLKLYEQQRPYREAPAAH